MVVHVEVSPPFILYRTTGIIFLWEIECGAREISSERTSVKKSSVGVFAAEVLYLNSRVKNGVEIIIQHPAVRAP